MVRIRKEILPPLVLDTDTLNSAPHPEHSVVLLILVLLVGFIMVGKGITNEDGGEY